MASLRTSIGLSLLELVVLQLFIFLFTFFLVEGLVSLHYQQLMALVVNSLHTDPSTIGLNLYHQIWHLLVYHKKLPKFRAFDAWVFAQQWYRFFDHMACLWVPLPHLTHQLLLTMQSSTSFYALKAKLSSQIQSFHLVLREPLNVVNYVFLGSFASFQDFPLFFPSLIV